MSMTLNSLRRLRALAQPASRMFLGAHVLRIFLGSVLLLHGLSKLSSGISGITDMVTAHGLPGFVAYGVYLGEVAAPILLLTGLWVRSAALLAAFNMVAAVALVHSAQVFTLGKSGGWAIELQAFYFVTALVVALQADRSSVCYKPKTA